MKNLGTPALANAARRALRKDSGALGCALALQAGDWLFLRPRQSEAVLTQFGPLSVVDGAEVVARWDTFAPSA